MPLKKEPKRAKRKQRICYKRDLISYVDYEGKLIEKFKTCKEYEVKEYKPVDKKESLKRLAEAKDEFEKLISQIKKNYETGKKTEPKVRERVKELQQILYIS